MIRIGRYTAALSLTALGILLLLDHGGYIDVMAVLKAWWPAVIVGLGFELLLVQAFHRGEKTRTRIAFGSLFGALLLGGLVLVATRGSEAVSWVTKWVDGAPWVFNIDDNAKFAIEKEVTHVTLPDSGKTLAISDSNGHIILNEGPVSDIEVKATVRVDVSERSEAEDIARASMVQVTEGDRIEIKAVGKAYGTGKLRKPRMDLTVTFPQGKVPASLTVEVDNGSVRIDPLSNAEELALDVKNGEVTGQNVNANLRVKLLNGEVNLSDLKKRANIEVVNGDVRLRDVFGALTVSTVHGDIDIQSPSVGGHWDISSTVGNVDLAWADGVNADINAKTMFGHVDTDWPLNVSKHEMAGKLGDGTWRVSVDSHADISLMKFEP